MTVCDETSGVRARRRHIAAERGGGAVGSRSILEKVFKTFEILNSNRNKAA